MSESPDRYSHGHHESVLRSHRWRTAHNSAGFLLSHLNRGDRVLDVGCGPGTITVDLAKLASPGGVVGIDRSAEVIDAARSHTDGACLSNLEFRVGDVYDLDFEDGSFDVVFAHQVLQHLSDPVRALAQMRRVLAPGGLVAVRDADYGAFAWSPTNPGLERWMELYHEIARRNRAEPDAGRVLAKWVRAAGFEDLEVTSSNWTFFQEDERLWWGRLWADRVRQSEFALQAVEYDLTTIDELEGIAQAFLDWASSDDGVFIVVNGEVLART